MTQGATTRQAERHRATGAITLALPIAEELPVAFSYNGMPHAVMMATPADLEAFALGFSLTEAVIASPAELLQCRVTHGPLGVTLDLKIPAAREVDLVRRKRAEPGPSGCGLCGIESLEAARRPLPKLTGTQTVSLAAIRAALADLPRHQPLNQAVGAVHAAAYAGLDGTILVAAEDVGRHNALDKLVGKLALQDRPPGFLVLTSRCSFELVAKAVMAGIEALVAISAPTSLALDEAESAGLGVVALARADALTLYANRWRFTGAFEPQATVVAA